MTSMQWRAWLIVLAIASGLAGGVVYRWLAGERPAVTALPQAPGQLIGSRRPDIGLPDLAGTIHDLQEWDGKVLLINFWASWCAPCRRELPLLKALHGRFSGRGVQVIGVAVDQPDSARRLATALGVDYPVLVGEAAGLRFANEYGNHAGALPYTVVVDRDGIVRGTHAGELRQEQVEAWLVPLL